MGVPTLPVDITAIDTTMLSLTMVFSITILDINEPPSDVALLEISGAAVHVINATEIRVSENAPVRVPMARVSAVDNDIADGTPTCRTPNTYFDIVDNELELKIPLDFETMPRIFLWIVCEDSGGLQSPVLVVNVNVLNANDAPMLASFTPSVFVPILESPNRTSAIVIGTVVGVDVDGNTSAEDMGITVEAGFSVTTPQCSVMGTMRACSANVSVLASTPLDYEGLDVVNGVQSVAVTFIDGINSSLTRSETVNVTIADAPDLPTGVLLSRTQVSEGITVGDVVTNVTIVDEDSTVQSYDVSLQNTNAWNAFSLLRITSFGRREVGGLEWQIVVNNASAFDYETLAATSSGLGFSLTIVDLNRPAPGNTLLVEDSISVTDQALELVANSTTMSGYPGRRGVLFTLANQDRPSLVGQAVFSIVTVLVGSAGTALGVQPQDFALTSGVDACTLTVTRAIPTHPPLTIQVQVQYAYASGVYLPGSQSFTLQLTDPPLPPMFTLPPAPIVVPYGGTTVAAIQVANTYGGSELIAVSVRTPAQLFQSTLTCPMSATGLRYPLPLDFRANRWATACDYVAENYMDLDLSLLQYDDRDTGFTACDAVPSGGTCAIQLNAAVVVSEAELRTIHLRILSVGSDLGLASYVPVSIIFADACGNGPSGMSVVPSQCTGLDQCRLSDTNPLGYECFTTTTTISMTTTTSSTPTTTTMLLLLDSLGSVGDNGDASGSSVGLIVGITLMLVVILLVLAVIYLRNREQNADVFDSDAKKRQLQTVANPTYASGEPGQQYVHQHYAVPTYETPQDSSDHYSEVLVPGVSNALYDWYQPTMTRKDCATYLSGQGEGAFVVRDSDANPGWHMLGVKTRNQVVHDKIRFTTERGYELLLSSGLAAERQQPSFQTLPDLVEHYMTIHDGMEFTLVASNPIYDNHQLIQERTGATVKKLEDQGPQLPHKGGLENISDAAYLTIDGVSSGTDF